MAQWANRPLGAIERMRSRLMRYLGGKVQASGSVESVVNPLIVPTILTGTSGESNGPYFSKPWRSARRLPATVGASLPIGVMNPSPVRNTLRTAVVAQAARRQASTLRQALTATRSGG